MLELRRVTTEYFEREDRIRLLGETASGASLAVWLTQRLVRRSVPVGLRWLDERVVHHPADPKLLHGFAQEAAVQSLPSQKAVVSVSDQESCLPHSIDFTFNDKAIRLTFKSAECSASLRLSVEGFRQWLAIVQGQWIRAGWPSDIWPPWMTGVAAVQLGAVKH